MPTFDGDYTKFNEFKSLFDLMVHKNKEMGKVEKLHQLKKFTRGRPRDLLEKFTMSAESYTKAYEMMITTYDKPLEVKKALMKELKTMEKFHIGNMRHGFDRIRAIVSSVEKYRNIDTDDIIKT
ncbi:unnamed protein product, partial [Auanema sp. JU1783]